MRERRKRGMRAVEIEAAEKCGQCRKSSLQPVWRSCVPPPILFRVARVNIRPILTGAWPLNRSWPLVNRGWSAHRLNSLALTPKSISAERMGGARRSSPPAGQTLTKRCESRITRGILTVYYKSAIFALKRMLYRVDNDVTAKA